MKQNASTIFLVLILIIGLSLLLYPSFSDWWNASRSSQAIATYSEEVANLDKEKYDALWDDAWRYNQALLDRPNTYLLEDAMKAEYDRLLNLSGTGIMGYIEIPRTDTYLPISHGTDAETLEKSVGHVIGSSLPVGGEGTHTVLSGHSGMSDQKMFSDLDRLKIGDIFFLDVLGEKLAYQVDQIKTVLPYDTTFLQTEIGNDLCTLVTCTPFGVNTHRLLVRGTRIEYEEAEVIVEEKLETEEPVKSTWEQQYLQGILIGIGAVVILGLGLLIFWYVRRRRNG